MVYGSSVYGEGIVRTAAQQQALQVRINERRELKRKQDECDALKLQLLSEQASAPHEKLWILEASYSHHQSNLAAMARQYVRSRSVVCDGVQSTAMAWLQQEEHWIRAAELALFSPGAPPLECAQLLLCRHLSSC